MMNHNLKIAPKGRENHAFHHRPQRVFKEMSASDRTLADDDPLRIKQVHNVSDSQSEIPSHLVKDSYEFLVSGFSHRDYRLQQSRHFMVIQRSFRYANTGLGCFAQNRKPGSVCFHAALLAALACRSMKNELRVPELCS